MPICKSLRSPTGAKVVDTHQHMLSIEAEHDASRQQAIEIAHLRATLNGVQLGLLTFDGRLDVMFMNACFAVMLGIEPSMPGRGGSLIDVLTPCGVLDRPTVLCLRDACLAVVAAGNEQRPTVLTLPGAASRRFAVQLLGLADGAWMASFEEVTARLAADATTAEGMMSDPLTGLPNRQLFQKRLVAALEQPAEGPASPGTGPAILLVDLDRFKAVNDTLGHPVGDGLLRLVAKRLRSALRPADLIARLGGDEFIVLVSPPPEPASLAALAQRIVDMIGRPYLVDGHQVNIGASVGVSQAPGGGCDEAQLMRAADLALYHAKNSGRGTVSFFQPEMDTRALARRTLEIDLRKALALQQFELFYQPQIDLEADKVVGFEALLRWRHPERGLVSPADFIPLAEEIGLIVQLGEWVLQEACCEAAGWPAEVSVAVNVSPHQFADPARLLNTVSRSLAYAGLPGRRLEIEITESVLLRNEAVVLQALHRLRAMEVRVAMDDFGTGYSSLSQLHSFPFDKIKIDRSFVTDRGDTAGQNAIIRAITALGVSLGMATIAEGVETADQLNRIRTEGCTSVQGYLYSRPVPADQVAGLIQTCSNRLAPTPTLDA